MVMEHGQLTANLGQNNRCQHGFQCAFPSPHRAGRPGAEAMPTVRFSARVSACSIIRKARDGRLHRALPSAALPAWRTYLPQ